MAKPSISFIGALSIRGVAASAVEAGSLCLDSLLAESTVPVMIVDAATGKIEECNPAAARLFHVGRDALVGSSFLESFASSAAPSVLGCSELACKSGRAETCDVATSRGAEVSIRLSLCHTGAGAYLLVHPSSRSGPHAGPVFAAPSSGVLSAVHEASIGFLVTDTNFLVEYANRVFLRLIDSRNQADVLGQPIGRWLTMTAMHQARLGALLSRREALEDLTTTLRCERGVLRAVRVAAVAVPHGRDTGWGFCLRELSHLN